MRINLVTLANWLGAPLPAEDRIISGVKTDNRQCGRGDLFVCLSGQRVDGHDYASGAAENGASAILASKPLGGLDVPVLRVEDTRRALGRLAHCWRGQSSARVVCITGTAGKTTLKAALSAILNRAGKTATASGNRNNQIGLPLSMLCADGDEDFWVMEAGISKAGDMEELGAIVEPDLAIILNVGQGHTLGLGDRGVAWHKSRLLTCISDGGFGLVSADYPELAQEVDKLGPPVLRFCTGRDARAEFRGEETGSHGVYRLWLGNHYLTVRTPLWGEYGAETAIAAAAAASLLGVQDTAIEAGLASFDLPEQRFRLMHVGAWDIFDDTYNANPLSMRRMLAAAGEYAKSARRPLSVFLGEMGELGSEAQAAHASLGKYLAEIEPAAIFWKGAYAQDVEANLPRGLRARFHLVENPEELTFPGSWLENGGVALFKGSRSNRMEQLLQSFVQLCARGAGDVL